MTSAIRSANRVTVSLSALRHNYRLLLSTLPEGVPLLAMVKGDGYGHGMVEAASAFGQAGCSTFGVAELCEAVKLREAGIAGEIYVMVGFAPGQAEAFFTHELVPVVFSREAITELSAVAARLGREIGVQLKIDCGMSRLGVMPEEVAAYADLIASLPGIHLSGVLSHFPEADNSDSPSTGKAFATFTAACASLDGRFSGLRHIANSGGVLNFPETLCSMGRAGISLYGYPPSGQPGDDRVAGERLLPAMGYSTRIAMVKEVPAGSGISYGHTHVVSRPTRLAVLPVGYEDGYPRCLSGKAEVLIHGRRVAILGRICMNLCMADITGIDGVTTGDEAVLLGGQGEEMISADEIAGKAGTISYEILCMLGNNNEREYID